MKNGTKAGHPVQRQIRMGPELLERVQQYQQRMQKETGLEINFSTAVRALIEKGLEAR